MKIAVTGATGYIGRQLVRVAAERGHGVLALVRRPNDELARFASQHAIDGQLPRYLEGVDAIIHLAGLAHVCRTRRSDGAAFDDANRQLALTVAEAAQRACVARFAYVSSIGVHGNWSGDPIVESSPFAPDTPYAMSKLMGEQALARFHVSAPSRLVIVRPPMVYGPDCPGNFPRLARLVTRGLPLPFAAVSARRSFVHVGNLIDFLLEAVRPGITGECFVVGDGSDFSLAQLVTLMAGAAGVRSRMFPVPPALLRAGARAVRLRREMESLTRPMLVDWSHARTALGWSPPFEPDEAMAITLAASWPNPPRKICGEGGPE